MATSEQIVSPGVFTNEVDQSFLPAAVCEIGAAVIGPTVKGPAMIPTVVSSMSEFEQIFGGAQKSGSDSFSYLTSLTARSYLQNQNKYLKKKLEELTRKYKDLEHEFDRLYEENQNIRLVRNEGKVL